SEDRRPGLEDLRASQEQLAQIRRAQRAVEAAAQPIARRERPIDQGLVRLDLVDLRHAPVRYASAELDVEVLDARRAVRDDWDQELSVELGDVELAAADRLRKHAGDALGHRG